MRQVCTWVLVALWIFINRPSSIGTNATTDIKSTMTSNFSSLETGVQNNMESAILTSERERSLPDDTFQTDLLREICNTSIFSDRKALSTDTYGAATCDEVIDVEDITDSYNITDPELLQILQYELLFCTDMDLCGLKGRYTNDWQPCCNYGNKCSCADDCKIGGNCCVGAVETFSELVDANGKTGCYSPLLYSNNFYDIDAVTMVDKCLDSYTQFENLAKCENRTSGFERDPFLHVPVYSRKNKQRVYKNKYCALCSYSNEDDLIYWKIEATCKTDKTSFVYTGLQDLFEFVKKERYYCNILFENPIVDGKVSSCRKAAVEECGYDIHVDPFHRRACDLYTSIYEPHTTDVNVPSYKNIFCYLCNGFSIQDAPNKCNPGMIIVPNEIEEGPFTILIDFNSLVSRKESRDSLMCTSQQIYDPFVDRCWDVFCSEELLYSNNTCVSAVERENKRSYTIRYLLKHQTNVTVGNDGSVRDNVVNNIVAEFSQIMEAMNMKQYLCRILVSLISESKSSHESTIDVVEKEHVLVDIELNVDRKHSPFDIAQNLLSLSGRVINVTVVNESYYFEIEAVNKTSEVKQFSMPPYIKYPAEILERIVAIKDHIEKHFLDLFEVSVCDKETIRLFVVSPFRMCPKVTVPVKMFQTDNDTKIFCMKDRSVCLDQSQILIEGDNIIACVADLKLLESNSRPQTKGRHSDVATILSIVLTALSIACLTFTFLTYSIFPSLRTLPGKNNMTLCVSLICAQILYQIGTNRIEHEVACCVIGALTHYTWLVSICFMNVCTFHMFKTFAIPVNNPSGIKSNSSRSLIFYIIYSLLLPVVFILANVIISMVQTDLQEFGYGKDRCYIDSAKMIAFTFALPVGLLVLSNFVFFVIVIYKIQRVPEIKSSTHGSRQNFLVYIKLSCVTGVFWITGFVYQWTEIEALGYLFIILNASQGIFIMLSFVCNKRVLNLYQGMCKGAMYETSTSTSNENKTAFSNISNST